MSRREAIFEPLRPIAELVIGLAIMAIGAAALFPLALLLANL